MLKLASRVAIMVAVTGGVALAMGGVAQADPGRSVNPPQPGTASAATGSLASIRAYCEDGTRIRSSAPSGTVLGLCYNSHNVSAHCKPSPAHGYWVRITDNTTRVSGWVNGSLVKAVGWETLPNC
ncbi:hypothetical protein [Longispora urticae]